MDWTYFVSKFFQFLEFACDDSINPSPVPPKAPRIMAHAASRGTLSHAMFQRPDSGDFDDLDSTAAIFCQTSRWKSGGICGLTFHRANFFLSSSSIHWVKHPPSEKPSPFFQLIQKLPVNPRSHAREVVQKKEKGFSGGGCFTQCTDDELRGQLCIMSMRHSESPYRPAIIVC
jgi:hypothetical protein